MNATNYPLSWPDNWPRTKFQKTPKFQEHTVSEAVLYLIAEVNRLNGRYPDFEDPYLVISTNVKPTLAGRPMSNQAEPQDVGVAVYFKLKAANSMPIVLACDTWRKVSWNVWAIAKHIESLRAQDRWGVGKLQQAFRGYAALPGIGESSGMKWWEELGVPINATEEQVRKAYRELAKVHHPDVGGDGIKFSRLSNAIDLFDQQLRQPK